MGITCKVFGERKGQGTVEFAAMFPVVIVIAAIAMNALLFFGECASFDRLARQAVRAVAASPAYGQGSGQSLAQVQQVIEQQMAGQNLSTSVVAQGTADGFTRYVATLEFSPTLFGLGLKDQVMGVPLPKLHHSVDLTLDTYRPGVLL